MNLRGRLMTAVSSPTDKSCDLRVQRALAVLLDERSHRPGRMTQIASSFNLSLSRFRHLFKEETGFPPEQYLKLAKLCRARELMKHSALRVKEVAAVVGISDVSHFVRDYKALHGETPTYTRKAYWLLSSGQQSRLRISHSG
jgi:AraC-like DNA-binding protein